MPLQQDTEGFTALAMGDPAQQQGHGLYAEFYMHPVQNQAASEEEGRPIYEEQEYIRIMVPGDKSTVIERPVRMGSTPVHDNHKFAREYAAFTQNGTQGLTGTPLKEWPQMSRSQVKELEFFNVHTVEQLAEMADSNIQNFRGMAEKKQAAINYLEAAHDGAPMVKLESELKKRDNEIDALKGQVEELIKELGESKGRKKRPLAD